MLPKVDAFVLAMGAEALADIDSEHVFQELWDCLALPPDLPTGERSTRTVRVQTDTRPSGCSCRRILENRLVFRGQCSTRCAIPLSSGEIGRT